MPTLSKPKLPKQTMMDRLGDVKSMPMGTTKLAKGMMRAFNRMVPGGSFGSSAVKMRAMKGSAEKMGKLMKVGRAPKMQSSGRKQGKGL